MRLKTNGNDGGTVERNTSYTVHTEAEPSSFPSLSIFRGELKVDLDDPVVVYLRAYPIQDKNLLVSARRTRRHEWGDR